MTVLAFRDVTRRFPDGLREVAVLDGVSFELCAGETVGVLASRGAGKTTLLRVAAGLEAPDEGEVCWHGRNLAGLSADERARVRRRGGIALARGDWRGSDAKVVLEHVAMPLYSEGLGIERAKACARRALETVQAPGLGYLPTGRLSLAERLRVELARAIVREPAVLLVDEPAVLPRPKEAEAFYALVHSLPKQLGLSLLIASEEVSALRGAGRVMNLTGGRLYSTDSRRKVISFPERREGRGTSAGAP
ncbi:MAG TPA: ATP-binding cassette domain-containing protein [Solirubrobacteraceae bacterium]|nr:ATP-binding cassette domain-containing protein [Solirubrobacteraceae bacterium]